MREFNVKLTGVSENIEAVIFRLKQAAFVEDVDIQIVEAKPIKEAKQ